MLIQRTAEFARQAGAFAAAFVLVGWPGGAAAETKGPVTIERIETLSKGNGRDVVIHTDQKATYSVFLLSSPFRILVDVNNARAREALDLLKVNDGVVRYLSTQRFSDGVSSILRVEIALEKDLPYRVRASDRKITVSVEGESPAADVPAKVNGSASEPAKSGTAVREKPEATPKPEAADKAVPAGAPAREEVVELGKLKKKVRGDRVVLRSKLLKGNVEEAAVRIEQLENPGRVLVDVVGAKIRPKWQRLKIRRRGVERARIASNPDRVRFVLDLKSGEPVPQVDVTVVGQYLEIAVSPPQMAKATQAAKGIRAAKTDPAKTKAVVEPKVAEAPVAKTPDVGAGALPTVAAVVPPASARPQAGAGQPATGPLSESAQANVLDVRFDPKEGFFRLTVELDGVVQVEQPSKGQPGRAMLRLKGVLLPEVLERTLDVTAIAGRTVESVSTYQEGSDSVLVASLSSGTEHRHWTKGNRVMWDFRNKAEERTEIVHYGEQATSGYAAAGGAQARRAAATLIPTKRRYKGRRISIDLKDADIQNVLRLLADVSKLNIVAASDVSGRITIKLRNVPWDQALDIILRSMQLDKVRNGNIIRVAPIEVLKKEEELRIDREKARIDLEPLTVRLIPVSYAVASEIKPQVTALLSPRGKVNIDVRTNVLVVEDIAEVLLKVERLVRTLDTQTPQVLIEARIVEARSSFTRELGIQWGGNVSLTQQFGTSTGLSFPNNIRIAGAADDGQNNVTEGVLGNPNFAINMPATVGSGGGGALGFIFGSAGGSALINLRLSAAEATGKVKIVSAPKVVTLDNKAAKILSGEKVPITVITANGPSTRFIDANIELQVRPHVTQDGSILMAIQAKKNELSDRVDLLGVPGIITKEAATQMIVRDGDTAVLGGLYRRTAQSNKSYVPWIGKIPVLGWLFKSSSRTDARDELLIFVSPRIVNRSQALVSTQ